MVRVGQGSTLSPVLSVLYITLVMHGFQTHPSSVGCNILSYVDDGTIITQSRSLSSNLEPLKKAYWVVNGLLRSFGLVLEHDKSEIFHFTKAHHDLLPSLALDPSTRLVPKTFWCYLGFFFDRSLFFREHVRYYSTKAFSTVLSVRMLGNSSRGLTPLQKCLLYRLCMVSVATYGYHLWFFKGTQCKTLMTLMNHMQRRAALWITGTFRTSPTMAIEAIAGLMPIHLHLSKLTQRSSVRMSTLHWTYVLYTFSSLYANQTQHPLSPLLLTERQTNKATGPLIEVVKHQPAPNETLTLLPIEGMLGLRLLDCFLDRFSLYPTDRAAKDPVHTQIACLDVVEHHSCTFPSEAVICIAASPSSDTTLVQPVAGVRVYHLGKLVASIKRPTGICLPQDAIIQVLCLGICKTLTLLPNLSFLQVMTINLPVMQSALRVDVGSNQGHRIAIANVLAPWLSLGETWMVHFWAIPSGSR
jgi:hypothetical protein